jgi:type VI secretion system protein ImpF
MPRFRPSLLDILLSGAQPVSADPEFGDDISPLPGIRRFSLDRVSEAAFMETVRRDLAWLVNTVNLSETLPLKGHPETAASVLNFGIPDFSARTFGSVDVLAAAADIRAALAVFEPRVAEETLRVTGEKTRKDDALPALAFTIECDVGPAAEAVRAAFRTEIDVETGNASFTEGR